MKTKFEEFLEEFNKLDKIQFSKKIRLPDVDDEPVFTIPDSEYTITSKTDDSIILNGLWKGKQSTFGKSYKLTTKEFQRLINTKKASERECDHMSPKQKNGKNWECMNCDDVVVFDKKTKKWVTKK